MLQSRDPLQLLLPKNKSKHGRPRSKSAPAVVSTKKVGDKNGKRWSNENMENLMHDVIDKNMPLLWAANTVPKSTLHDRISGKVKHGDKPRPKPLLAAAEENEFAIFLVEVSQAGYEERSETNCRKCHSRQRKQKRSDGVAWMVKEVFAEAVSAISL